MATDLVIYKSKTTRARVILGAVIVGALLFAWFSIRWQFGNMLADLVTPHDPNAIAVSDLAIELAPSDPLTHWLKASLDKDIFTPDKTNSAIAGFEETVRLSPNDYRWWIELGRAYEQADQSAKAEAAYDRAIDLAPEYTYPHWQLGNFYLRQGRTDEAFAQLKRSTERNQTYRQQVFSLAWDYFDKDTAKLEQVVADQPDVHASLALFYGARGRAADSLRMWNMLTEDAKAAHPQFLQVIAQGVYEQRYFPQALEFAKQLGMDMDAQPDAVTNPSFEKAVGDAAETRFGWRVLHTDPRLDISSDSSVKHDGARSLKVTFRNYAKADLYNILQTIVVEPKRNYRLRFWVRTENLKSAGGPMLEVVNGNDDKLIATSKSFPLGTSDWQEFVLDFSTPENCTGITLRTSRSFCGDTCPIAGLFWYDQFDLSKQ